MSFKVTIVEKFALAEIETAKAIKDYENDLHKKIAEVVSSEGTAEKRLEKLIYQLRQSNGLVSLKGKIDSCFKSCKLKMCSVNASMLKFFVMNVDPENPALSKLLGNDNSVSIKTMQTTDSRATMVKAVQKSESMSKKIL